MFLSIISFYTLCICACYYICRRKIAFLCCLFYSPLIESCFVDIMSVFFYVRWFPCFMMDPAISSCIPFEILEIVFLWLPLSVVIKFSTVCQQWKTVLQNPCFLLCCKHICTDEFGFMVPFVNDEDNYFVAEYLNQNGRISHFHLWFIDSRYKVESAIGPMVVLSLPTEFSHSRNYFVMNPFTKALKNIRRIRIGDWDYFRYWKMWAATNMTGLF